MSVMRSLLAFPAAEALPAQLFLAAVMLSASLGGTGPALLATAIGLVLIGFSRDTPSLLAAVVVYSLGIVLARPTEQTVAEAAAVVAETSVGICVRPLPQSAVGGRAGRPSWPGSLPRRLTQPSPRSSGDRRLDRPAELLQGEGAAGERAGLRTGPPCPSQTSRPP